MKHIPPPYFVALYYKLVRVLLLTKIHAHEAFARGSLDQEGLVVRVDGGNDVVCSNSDACKYFSYDERERLSGETMTLAPASASAVDPVTKGEALWRDTSQ